MSELSLTAVAEELARKAAESSSGRAAQTVHGGSASRLRQTVLALAAGQELAEHDNPGEATLQVLRGHVRLAGGGAAVEGRAGDLLVVPPERHGVAALEDSVVLLTAVPRG